MQFFVFLCILFVCICSGFINIITCYIKYEYWSTGRDEWYGILHVTRVSHTAVAGLRGALVEAHLQVDLTFAGAQLLLGERALVLVGHFRAQRRAVVFRMLLGLGGWKNYNQLAPGKCISVSNKHGTYYATQRVQAQRHLRNVATLEQISGLEDLLLRHAVLLDGRLEALHVLHQLEVGAALLDLLDRAGRQLIGQSAQHLAVLQDVLVLAGGHRLAEHGEHPRQHLQLLFLVARLADQSGGNSVCLNVPVLCLPGLIGLRFRTALIHVRAY